MTKTLLLLSSVLLCCCVHATRRARVPTPDEPHLRVTTYNLNFGIAGDPQTLSAIGEGDPDVVFVQETTSEWEASIRARYGERYRFMAFHHCCGAGGLGVLSKLRFTEIRYLEASSGWFPALRVLLNTPIGPLQVLSVHLHPPVTDGGSFVKGYFTTGSIREGEVKAFYPQLDRDLPTLVVGDFNEADGEALRFLQDQGLRSGLPEFAPEKKTWRWQLPVGSLSSRFDHILYNSQLEPLVVDVLASGNSDHLPVTAVFTHARAPRRPGAQLVQRSPGSLSLSP